jgi:hypothetical protein
MDIRNRSISCLLEEPFQSWGVLSWQYYCRIEKLTFSWLRWQLPTKQTFQEKTEWA